MSTKNNRFRRVLRTASIAALGAASVSLTACTEPTIFCSSGRGDFSVEYTLQSGAGECAMKLGEVVGMQTYNPVEDGRPQWGKPSVAVQPETLGLLLFDAQERGFDRLDAENDIYGLADFANGTPDGDNFCTAPTFSAARLALPDLPEVIVEDDPETPDEDESLNSKDAQAATVLAYEWSAMSFYTTVDSQGTQFTADLNFTQDGCNARYRARGVFPAVHCETEEECDDDANGMNPDFATHCNLDIGLCVLDEDPPSFD